MFKRNAPAVLEHSFVQTVSEASEPEGQGTGRMKSKTAGTRAARKALIKNALVELADEVSSPPVAAKDGFDIAIGWSIIGIFIVIGSAVVHELSGILMPITLAMVVGTILGRAADRLARFGLPPAAGGLVLGAIFVVALFLLVNALVEPLSSLVSDIPAMVDRTLQRLGPMISRFEWLRMSGLGTTDSKELAAAAVENAGPVLGIVAGSLTPALVQTLIFLAALGLFMVSRANLRRALIMMFPYREQRLSVIRIVNAIESVLGYYFSMAFWIYAVLGIITMAIAWLGGLQMAPLWGVLAFISSFIPYLGVTLMTIALAGAGFMTHDGILVALAPSFAFFVLHLVMENLVTPSIMGRRLEINPFIVFVAIIFWTWMWGAVGAMLALPLCLIAMTVFDELTVVEEGPRLPG